ncbi:MAG TPA: thiamine pyrophosphate-dependent dehydrogenase E1 component subunit alpha [Xanthobacteraceae bacterium]|nr:thiamine pyrophosphate-dependent dehydrogenase E1 component subunit alpha [Xanthobacteraceae bacterium]
MPTLDRRTSLSIFQRMLMIRHFEEAVIALYKQGRFASHYHLYIGQEATGSAVLETLSEKDLICTTHRNHGHIIGRGCDPNRAMAEILGRASGFNGGRSGTLHICDHSHGFLSTSAVVGGCAGLATGAGFGLKVRREPHVAVGFFGDGALEEGLVSESFNIAALWKLPVVYVCENNSAGAMGPQQGGYPTAITATDSFTRLPAAYGIHCLKVDGTDIAAVYAAASVAGQRCRGGDGPVFIEAFTTRWPGSSPLWPELATVTDLNDAWDPARISGPHADWSRYHDPVLRVARELVAAGHASRDELMARDNEARMRIAAAANFAIDSPMPAPASVRDHVFA